MNRKIGATSTTAIVASSLLALGCSSISAPLLAATDQASGPATGAAAAMKPLPAPPANGRMGFVVSTMGWALGPDGDSISCPDGLSKMDHLYVTNANIARLQNESDQDFAKRQRAALPPDRGGGICMNPALKGPDPLFRTVAAGIPSKVYGLDLDGQDSHLNGKPKGATCAHDDFQGVNGEHGIDNQFYRVVGCTKGFQSSGGHRPFGQEMLTGEWGVLILLRNVHSLVNDNNIEVGIYANADPIALSAARKPLEWATYNPTKEPGYRAETHGRIVNGVLITDPVNVRFHWNVNTMWLDRTMDAARLRMKINPDGSLDGVMSGYTKVDELYDTVFGYRNGKNSDGSLSDKRAGSAGGAAASAGTSCNGLYYALKQQADGERDPKTGQCGAISNAYRLTAIPAFVVEKPADTTKVAAK